ncbi:hypothetical protein AC1031_014084 [Aphanomyces cochlioides]|nr:hypothetical protein AC1031_014084 [Aphanomyces cochlioides]
MFQAFGDFSRYRSQALTLTGRNEPVDWSMFVLPQSVNQLTFTKFQQIVLPPKFQWPQNLSSSKEDIQATMTIGGGTFRWMDQEVIQSQYYTTASDIYSFGTFIIVAIVV